MKNHLYLLLFIFFLSCHSVPNESLDAALLGANKISTEAPEFATTVNRKQTEIYFNRTTPDRSSMQIMYSSLKNGTWSDATALPFSTGLYRDVDPFLTYDENRLFFSSTRPTEPGGQQRDFDTWYVEKKEGIWSDPINPGAPLNSDSTEIFISLSKNGNAYFVSERDGERGIMVSRFQNNEYQLAERIRLQLKGNPIYASNPCIAADESFLIVAARDPSGKNPPDLYVTWNKNGKWSELENLGPEVNSPYAEFAPGLSKDDQVLFFTSERPGIVGKQEDGIRPPGDIYRIALKEVFAGLK